MRNNRMRFLICVSALALAGAVPLSACTTTGPDLKSPTAQFAQKISIEAARVQLVDATAATVTTRDVSSAFPTPLMSAINHYVQNRFNPVGVNGTAVFVVEEAHITRESVESSNRVARAFQLDNRDRYTALIRLKVSRENPAAPGAAYSELRVQRTWTIPDHLSLGEREREQNAFMTQLLRDMDAAVLNAIQNTLQIGASGSSTYAPAYNSGVVYSDVSSGASSAPAQGGVAPVVEDMPF